VYGVLLAAAGSHQVLYRYLCGISHEQYLKKVHDLFPIRIMKELISMEERLIRLLAKLETDKSMADKLFALETPGEVQSFLKEQGLEFSLDEINTLKDSLLKAAARHQSDDSVTKIWKMLPAGLLNVKHNNFTVIFKKYIKTGGSDGRLNKDS
jgi:hypothetical protein